MQNEFNNSETNSSNNGLFNLDSHSQTKSLNFDGHKNHNENIIYENPANIYTENKHN